MHTYSHNLSQCFEFLLQFFLKFRLSKWLLSLGKWGLHTQGWEALGGVVCPWVFHHELCQTKNRFFSLPGVLSAFFLNIRRDINFLTLKKKKSCFATGWRLEKALFYLFSSQHLPNVFFNHQQLMLTLFNYLLLSPFPPTTSTKSTGVLQNKSFQIWAPLFLWDPPDGPAPNLLCGEENYFPYTTAVLPLLIAKIWGFPCSFMGFYCPNAVCDGAGEEMWLCCRNSCSWKEKLVEKWAVSSSIETKT